MQPCRRGRFRWHPCPRRPSELGVTLGDTYLVGRRAVWCWEMWCYGRRKRSRRVLSVYESPSKEANEQQTSQTSSEAPQNLKRLVLCCVYWRFHIMQNSPYQRFQAATAFSWLLLNSVNWEKSVISLFFLRFPESLQHALCDVTKGSLSLSVSDFVLFLSPPNIQIVQQSWSVLIISITETCVEACKQRAKCAAVLIWSLTWQYELKKKRKTSFLLICSLTFLPHSDEFDIQSPGRLQSRQHVFSSLA